MICMFDIAVCVQIQRLPCLKISSEVLQDSALELKILSIAVKVVLLVK
jgi:hypothetical protein